MIKNKKYSPRMKPIDINKLIELKTKGLSNSKCAKLLNVSGERLGETVKKLIQKKKIVIKKIPWNKGLSSVEKKEVECTYCKNSLKISYKKYNKSKSKKFYCTKKCEANDRRKNEIIILICKCCGEKYPTTNKYQKYCSNKCKNNSFDPQVLLKNQKINYGPERRSRVLKNKWAKDKEKMLEKRNTDEYRIKIGETTRERFENDSVFRAKHSQNCKEGWTSEKKEKQRKIALNRMNNKCITIPNLIVADYLKFLGVNYKMEQPIGNICRVDILINEKKIGIEIFGDYWHANPLILELKENKTLTYDQKGNTKGDCEKAIKLKEEYPQYKILYLWEGDIAFKWGECKNKILSELQIEEPIINMKDYKILKIDSDRAKMFCQKYHYLGKSFPIAPRVLYGLFYKEILVGIAVYSNTGALNAGNIVGNNVCELSRFCLYDSLPKNTASYFLSKTIHLIKKDISNLDGLISYSDDSIHLGTIYRATNWEELGSVKGSYYYLTPHSQKIDRRKVHGHCSAFSISESEYAKRMDLKKIDTPTKTKFVYRFN